MGERVCVCVLCSGNGFMDWVNTCVFVFKELVQSESAMF